MLLEQRVEPNEPNWVVRKL